MKKANYLPYFLSIIILTFWACASQRPPDGGEKDLQPPQMTKSFPDSAAIFVQTDKIEIQFDEFIQLNGLKQNLLISPALDKNPTFKVKGKRVEIQLVEKLKDSTTYYFNFGEGIMDYTEGNKVNNLYLVFSTGAYVDSLKFNAHLEDAQTGKNQKGKIFLYKNFRDSSILKDKPYYASNLSESGIVELKHLAPGKYTAIAILDENNNFKPDKKEMISLPLTVHLPDTIPTHFDLFKDKMNLPQVEAQYYHPNPEKTQISFNQAVTIDTLLFSTKSGTNKRQNPIVQRWNYNHDTLTLFHPPIEKDSIQMKLIIQSDTLNYKKYIDSLSSNISLSTSTSTFYSSDSLVLHSNIPITAFNSTEIQILADTQLQSIPFTAKVINKDQLVLKTPFELDKPYTIIFNKYALRNQKYYNLSDTFKYKLPTKESFGSLEMLMDSTLQNDTTVLQILNGDKIVYSQSNPPSKLSFNLMKPGIYNVQILYDKNKDGRYTPGDYFEGRKPEKVIPLPKQLEIRENWSLKDVIISFSDN